MNNENRNHQTEKKSYSVLFLLLIGVAVFSSAINDLNQIQKWTSQAQNVVVAWSDMVVPTVSASVGVPSTACRRPSSFRTQSIQMSFSGAARLLLVV